MQEELISFETAKLAKEKGFDAPSHYYYSKSKTFIHHSPYNQLHLLDLAAPTQSLLQKWLREVHKLHITLTSISQESWQYHITKVGESLGIRYEQDFNTYEEALEVGLLEGLKLIK